jgi:3-keto-5-aminohexanoate cleavage enzyme
MTRKVIVTVAPTGGFLTKSQQPHIPTQPEEIADDVARCVSAGASVAALHARRPDDEATCDRNIYRQINKLVRERCDVVINNSTGGGVNGDMLVAGTNVISFDARREGLFAGADTCTMDGFTAYASTPIGEFLMDTPPSRIRQLLREMGELGIKPEWEVFNPSHLVSDMQQLTGEGFDEPPYIVNIVLGMDGVFQNALPYKPEILEDLVSWLPPQTVFTATLCGDLQMEAMAHALALGGHVRVGIEDVPFDRHGTPQSNLEQVQRAVALVEAMGLALATPSDARDILGLPERTHVNDPSEPIAGEAR